MTVNHKTNYFSHCWGVFEGGGVRGAAHAGAFEEAKKSGISFERLAGASAGSIVAALIAAGGKPEYISNLLIDTDFNGFLSPPIEGDSIYKNNINKLGIIKYIPLKKLSPIKDIIFNSGMHSSSKIQEWLESKLQDILGDYREPSSQGVIRFSELKIPLHIIATNILTGLPQIWSTETTPDVSVSYAVRCSCSIPFFFQPISEQNSIYVDGGVISNIPSFIFSKLLDEMSVYTKRPNIINFRLTQKTTLLNKPKNIIEYFEKLSNAVVSGGSEVQKILQTSTYNINIDTGNVSSTDFKSIDEQSKSVLHMAGKSAVRHFISNERALFKAGNINATSRGFDEKMLMLIQQIRDCTDELIISEKSCKWLDFIFPTIFIALKKGVKITCLVKESDKENTNEIRFHTLLENISIKIIYVEELPFNGFLFSPFKEHTVAILTTNGNNYDAYKNEMVKMYDYFNDRPIIDILKEKIDPSWLNIEGGKFNFIYTPCSDLDLISKLKNVRQYKNSNFSLKDIQVDDNILSMSDSVKEYKVEQIKNFIFDIKNGNRDLEVYKIELLDGSSSIITPPVLEKINDKFYIIEGNARLFYCFNNGINSIKAVVVENVSDTLPSQKSNPLSKLRLTSLTKTMYQNYTGIDKSKFRHIESAMHPYPPVV
ncbi:patatin-like phospholipase family protein [Klebsiella pneumoniae]|uniref:patatin-like phospholipase family protein n=1 Tax=Klebsiella pneumoniae TaxID=573 RepID=UPI003D073294